MLVFFIYKPKFIGVAAIQKYMREHIILYLKLRKLELETLKVIM